MKSKMGARVEGVRAQVSKLEQMPEWSWNPFRQQWWGGVPKTGIAVLNETAVEVKAMLRETRGADQSVYQTARDLVVLAQDKLGYRDVPPSQCDTLWEAQLNVAEIKARLKGG